MGPRHTRKTAPIRRPRSDSRRVRFSAPVISSVEKRITGALNSIARETIGLLRYLVKKSMLTPLVAKQERSRAWTVNFESKFSPPSNALTAKSDGTRDDACQCTPTG
jgi:hypothetical protein